MEVAHVANIVEVGVMRRVMCMSPRKCDLFFHRDVGSVILRLKTETHGGGVSHSWAEDDDLAPQLGRIFVRDPQPLMFIVITRVISRRPGRWITERH